MEKCKKAKKVSSDVIELQDGRIASMKLLLGQALSLVSIYDSRITRQTKAQIEICERLQKE